MSSVASRIVPVTVGNTARALSDSSADSDFLVSQPLPEKARKPARAPLSLVVSTPRTNKTPLVAALFVLLVGALAAVLIMSVSVSKGQYLLVDLKNQQTQLANANQASELDLVAHEAPQSLVAKAASMGMVPAGTTGQIDVRTKKVTGNPMPAVAGTKGLVVIPSAVVNEPMPVTADTAASAVTKEEAAAAEAATATKQGAASALVADKSAKAAAVAAGATPDLNGGTIPSPEQKGN